MAQATATASAGGSPTGGFRPPPANSSSWPEHLRTEMSEEEAAALREEVRGMFKFAYQGYLEHAFPRDELSPLSCRGVDTLGGYALTLVDTLDTLVVMGEAEEFARAVRWVGANLTFDLNSTVSVFETNIRVLGGLLAGHELAQGGPLGVPVEGYRGELLELARDLGERLLPAFKTPTGMPFGSVHLQDGVLPLETPVTSTACAGTLALEFGRLSRLTGDPAFRLAALRSARGVWSRRSRLNLVGGHVDVQSGNWIHKDAGIGTSIDSFYEYLLKSYVLHGFVGLAEHVVRLLVPVYDVRLEEVLVERVDAGADASVLVYPVAGLNVHVAPHEVEPGAPRPDPPRGAQGGQAEGWVPGEAAESPEFQRESTGAGRRGYGRLERQDAVLEVDRPERHPRRGLEGRQQPLSQVARQLQELPAVALHRYAQRPALS